MRLLHFPPLLLLLGLLPAALAYRFLDRASRPPFVVYGLRWFLGLIFTLSGLAKLIPGFPNTMGPVNLEATLAPHGLALFARFVAVSEVGVGLLLLTRRFATLGALMLAPMLVSILIVTTSLQWRGTPFVVAGFLALTLALLLYDYPKLAPLLGERPAPASGRVVVITHASPLGWLVLTGVLLIGLGAIHLEMADTLAVLLVIIALLGLVVADWRSVRGTGYPPH